MKSLIPALLIVGKTLIKTYGLDCCIFLICFFPFQGQSLTVFRSIAFAGLQQIIALFNRPQAIITNSHYLIGSTEEDSSRHLVYRWLVSQCNNLAVSSPPTPVERIIKTNTFVQLSGNGILLKDTPLPGQRHFQRFIAEICNDRTYKSCARCSKTQFSGELQPHILKVLHQFSGQVLSRLRIASQIILFAIDHQRRLRQRLSNPASSVHRHRPDESTGKCPALIYRQRIATPCSQIGKQIEIAFYSLFRHILHVQQIRKILLCGKQALFRLCSDWGTCPQPKNATHSVYRK